MTVWFLNVTVQKFYVLSFIGKRQGKVCRYRCLSGATLAAGNGYFQVASHSFLHHRNRIYGIRIDAQCTPPAFLFINHGTIVHGDGIHGAVIDTYFAATIPRFCLFQPDRSCF